MGDTITVEVRPEHLERALAYVADEQRGGTYTQGCLMNQALRDAVPGIYGHKALPPAEPDNHYGCGPKSWGIWGGQRTGSYDFDQEAIALVAEFDSAIQDHRAFAMPLPQTVLLTRRGA